MSDQATTSANDQRMMDKLANSVLLMVGGRFAMIATTLVLAPLILVTVNNLVDRLSEISKAIVELRLQGLGLKSEMINLKTLSEYQLRSFDDRLSAQSRRMDTIDGRIDRLERPFFGSGGGSSGRSGPAFPPPGTP